MYVSERLPYRCLCSAYINVLVCRQDQKIYIDMSHIADMENDQTDDDVFEPYVLMDIAEDGTGVFSVIVDEETHLFEISVGDDMDSMEIEYQETLGWRGQVLVSEPDDDVYDILLESDEFNEYIEHVILASMG